MHICVSNIIIIGSDNINGLLPVHRKAIIWTNAGILSFRNKFQWNFNQNQNIFDKKNPFQNVVSKKADILSRPQCVNNVILRFVVMGLYCIRILISTNNKRDIKGTHPFPALIKGRICFIKWSLLSLQGHYISDQIWLFDHWGIYVPWSIGSSSINIMVCGLYSTKPLS